MAISPQVRDLAVNLEAPHVHAALFVIASQMIGPNTDYRVTSLVPAGPDPAC